MNLGPETKLEDLGVHIKSWSPDNYPAFGLCITKLIDFNTHIPSVLVIFLQHLCERIQYLTPDKARQLFDCFLDSQCWIDCEEPVPTEIVNILVTFASQFPDFLPSVCSILVEFLLPKHPKGSNSLITSCVHATIVDRLLKSLMSTVPRAESVLSDELLEKFPNWRKSLTEVLTASFNVLYLLIEPGYSKYFSNNSKRALFSALCEFVIELELNPDGCAPIDLSYNADTETTNVIEINQDLLIKIMTSLTPKDDRPGLKLELVTWLIISHLRVMCGGESKQLNWDLLCSIFKRLRDLFVQNILPIGTTDVVAFPLICFCTSNLRSGLPISFSDCLWNIVKGGQQDVETRLNALSYLTWAVTRLKCFFMDLTLELLVDMSAWCVDYAYLHRNPENFTETVISENRVYYAVCCSVFYIIAYLHVPLLTSNTYRACIEQLPLTQIKLSSLNPWTRVPARLKKRFCEIVCNFKLAFYSLGFNPLDLGDNGMDDGSGEFDLSTLEPSDSIHLPMHHCPFTNLYPFLQRLLNSPASLRGFATKPSAVDARNRKKLRNKRRATSGVDTSKFARVTEFV